jgi:hypothetical protein
MLKGIHFLLSYSCTYECDHCFVQSGPFVGGTFTIDQVIRILDQAVELGTVKSVYFEGGEPFLFYPLMLEGIRQSRDRGFSVGIVTNGYWATSEADARLWLEPLVSLGISDLSMSDDTFHGDEGAGAFVRNGIAIAEKLGLPVSSICIDEPRVERQSIDADKKGEPIVGGDVVFRGRAADKLTDGLPTRSWQRFSECTREELEDPGRVHVDAFGNVHVCQGLSAGTLWKTPLPQLWPSYNAGEHPICGPLLKGGPAELARRYDVPPEPEYVDECHFCYSIRRALIDRFPEYLGPRSVYGLDEITSPGTR